MSSSTSSLVFVYALRCISILCSFCCTCTLFAQRHYAAQSVLSSGTWYKVAVAREGVYKLDVPFLTSLGISTSNLGSASIRVYGNGGGMLPEDNAVFRPDDLVENPLLVFDGGDGILNGTDYVCFYAPGPHHWYYDSSQHRFLPATNLYSNQSYYFISIQGQGKRIQTAVVNEVPNLNTTTYDFRYYHELDTLNFLKSGKEWYGETLGNAGGSAVKRTFTINVQGVIPGSPVSVVSNVAARSVGAASTFGVSLNGRPIDNIHLPAITGNIQEAFATAAEQSGSIQFGAIQNNIAAEFTLQPGTSNAQGWLNRFQLYARAQLQFGEKNAFHFNDASTTGAGNVVRYTLQGASTGTAIFDVTKPLAPILMNGTLAGDQFSFVNRADSLRQYFAFKNAGLLTPTFIAPVPNQNLHNLSPADLLVVCHNTLVGEAQRLATFHRQQNGLRVNVVPTDAIFNEFGSGTPDPTAIRDFVKMYYDKAGTDSASRPKYLLLFGDASYDYKNRVANNTNLVPAYQSINALEPLNTYTSDDFFGLLDDVDDINQIATPGLLDIAVGRIPAATSTQAKTIVDKIIHYYSPAALGDWRTRLTFVADDEDANLHLQDAEYVSDNAKATNPLLNHTKIYLDAYRQESGSSGSRYPAVNQAIVNQVFDGNLIWNYSGHGGSQRLAEEAVLDREVVKQFNNPDKLPLFVTATCDFAPYDDPGNLSLGDELLMGNEQGAIALTTTTRLVFAYSNRVMNNNFLQFALQRQANGTYLPLGEALRRAKNRTITDAGDVINNRKFTLLGDPALTLAIPVNQVRINTINAAPALGDTLSALQQYTFTGDITNADSQLLTAFNGFVYPVLFDKAQTLTTLANDQGSTPARFLQQRNVLYRGKASVVNGQFSFTFITPKDINYQVGNGRLSLYAENGLTDAHGIFSNFKIGGTGNNPIVDREGPLIDLFLNDDKFINGGLVNEAPVLLAYLDDSSGINTAGTGIGHDITLVIDGDERNVYVLNAFYQAKENSFQQGSIRFQLPVFSNGHHTITIKAWDVANNSSTVTLNFIVANKQQLQIEKLVNYPNPFTTSTTFSFQHNQPAGNLQAQIQIYSFTGKLVYQIQRIINSIGNRSTEIVWNGRDMNGAKLGKGVYVYRLIVMAIDGRKVTKTSKLYLL